MGSSLYDNHFAFGTLDDTGAQKTDIGRNSGSSSNHNDIGSVRCFIKAEMSGNLCADIYPVADIEIEQPRGQLTRFNL